MRWNNFNNLIISNFDALKYKLIEPIQLKRMRLKYEKEYQQEKNSLVSVYIPTYNRAEILIERALPSVLKQTYKNIELIIIGDHCTDNTEKYMKKIKDPRVRFFNIPERGYRYPPTAENHWFAGPVVAANVALEMVRGKWIARIDDDDTWTENHIEKLLAFAQKNNHEFVSAKYLSIRDGKETIINGVGAKSSYYTRKDTPIKGYNPLIGGTSTWLYRSYIKFIKYNRNCWRKSWNKVNDIDFSQRIFKAGVRMGFLDETLAFVIPRPGEETIGLDAYIRDKKNKESHFKF